MYYDMICYGIVQMCAGRERKADLWNVRQSGAWSRDVYRRSLRHRESGTVCAMLLNILYCILAK